MTTFKIFQLEKNNEDIRKTVLTNVIKMFTERNLLKYDDMDKNIKKILSIHSDDHTYIIDIDGKDGSQKCTIKMFNQKITAISKQSPISDFLIKFKDSQKVIIVKNISTKARQYVVNNYPKTEIFLESYLMINLVDNVLVPKYEILSRDYDNFKTFFEQYQCKKRKVPKMLMNDSVSLYYNLKRDDIVRIIRPSETSGYSAFYRLVI